MPWAAEQISLPKNPPRPYKTIKFKRLRFKSNGATTYTLARKQRAGRSFWDTHTNTNTHYTASSSIQAPFGCPATPALVPSHPSAGALPPQRWWLIRCNLCASAVRSCSCGASGTTNTTHTENISLRCALGCANPSPPKKHSTSLQNHEIQTAALQIKRRYELHPGRKTTSSAHRTLSISIPCRIHRALRRYAGTFAPLLFDPAPAVCRVCVQSNGRAPNQTALRTTPWHANTLAAHTAQPLFLSLFLVGYTALLGVALESALLLFDPALCGLPCLRTVATASFSSTAAYFLSLVPVAAHLRRVLWVSAMSFARYRLLLPCGCVFFALVKPYGVPPPRAAAESLHTHTMQRNVPTAER